MQFVRRVSEQHTQLLAVTPSDIVEKCIMISDGDNCYALQLPKLKLLRFFHSIDHCSKVTLSELLFCMYNVLVLNFIATCKC